MLQTSETLRYKEVCTAVSESRQAFKSPHGFSAGDHHSSLAPGRLVSVPLAFHLGTL
jgi:hypothetical protein